MPSSYPIYGPDREGRPSPRYVEVHPPGVTPPPPDHPETEPETEPTEAEVPEPDADES